MSRGLLRTRTGALVLTVLAGIGAAHAGVEVNEDVLNGLGGGPGAVVLPGQGGSIYGGAVSRTPLPFNRADSQDRFSVPSVLPLRPYTGPRRGGIKLRPPGSAPKPVRPAVASPKPETRKDAEPAVAAAPVAPVRRQPDPAPAKSPVTTAPEAPLKAPDVVAERPAPSTDVAPEPPRQVTAVTSEKPQVAAVTPSAPAPSVPELAEKPAPVALDAEVTRIVFDETSSELPDGYQDVIAALASNIRDGSTARVQIHSYAFAENETLLWARRMAQRRAIIVRKVLRDEGITANRIAVRTDIDPDDDGPRNRVDLTILPPR